MDNPYALTKGGALRVRALVDGKPVANQLVVYGARTASGGTIAEQSTRADANGVATISVSSPGVWYMKFIRQEHLPKQADGVTHHSKWATLTFAAK